MAETIFASDLRFFFGADREWCQDKILPLFDWRNPDKAQRSWDGFLTVGRFNDSLLEAGLMDLYLETASQHMDKLRKDTRRSFYQHLAVIALVSGVDTLTWINEFTSAVADKASRQKLINSVTTNLGDLPPVLRTFSGNDGCETIGRSDSTAAARP